jgi:hypothetical protein
VVTLTTITGAALVIRHAVTVCVVCCAQCATSGSAVSATTLIDLLLLRAISTQKVQPIGTCSTPCHLFRKMYGLGISDMAATNAPKLTRRRRNKPIRGEWQPTAGIGWQHEPFPMPPDGLLEPSRTAWETWLRAWFAAHWTPDDLPGLRQVIRLYDQVERGEFQRATELRLLMDTYGITPKGQQDRRWTPPKSDVEPTGLTPSAGRYGHLRAVNE